MSDRPLHYLFNSLIAYILWRAENRRGKKRKKKLPLCIRCKMASRIREEAECDVGRLRGRLEGMQLEINTNQRKTKHAVVG